MDTSQEHNHKQDGDCVVKGETYYQVVNKCPFPLPAIQHKLQDAKWQKLIYFNIY